MAEYDASPQEFVDNKIACKLRQMPGYNQSVTHWIGGQKTMSINDSMIYIMVDLFSNTNATWLVNP